MFNGQQPVCFNFPLLTITMIFSIIKKYLLKDTDSFIVRKEFSKSV